MLSDAFLEFWAQGNFCACEDLLIIVSNFLFSCDCTGFNSKEGNNLRPGTVIKSSSLSMRTLRLGAGSASEDAPGKADKRLTNICPIACTRFNVSEFVTSCELFSFGKSNGTAFAQVAFVTDQDDGDRRAAYIAYIVQPHTEVVKSLAVGDVKNEDDTDGVSEICLSNWAETLLACSIPDPEIDLLAIDLDDDRLKVDADC